MAVSYLVKGMCKLALAILIFAGPGYSAKILAVLEITPQGDNVELSIQELRHLTDELRSQAVLALPQDQFSILTRDNIIALLPPDEEEAECLAEGCAVDIGRNIGAEYVAQGYVGKFGEMLTLTVELYETMGGRLLGSFVTESGDAYGLLQTIRDKAPALFEKMAPPPVVASSSSAVSSSSLHIEEKIAVDSTPQIAAPSRNNRYVGLAIAGTGAAINIAGAFIDFSKVATNYALIGAGGAIYLGGTAYTGWNGDKGWVPYCAGLGLQVAGFATMLAATYGMDIRESSAKTVFLTGAGLGVLGGALNAFAMWQFFNSAGEVKTESNKVAVVPIIIPTQNSLASGVSLWAKF